MFGEEISMSLDKFICLRCGSMNTQSEWVDVKKVYVVSCEDCGFMFKVQNRGACGE